MGRLGGLSSRVTALMKGLEVVVKLAVVVVVAVAVAVVVIGISSSSIRYY